MLIELNTNPRHIERFLDLPTGTLATKSKEHIEKISDFCDFVTQFINLDTFKLWVKIENAMIDGKTPLDAMLDESLIDNMIERFKERYE